jgi:hypothetical protein
MNSPAANDGRPEDWRDCLLCNALLRLWRRLRELALWSDGMTRAPPANFVRSAGKFVRSLAVCALTLGFAASCGVAGDSGTVTDHTSSPLDAAPVVPCAAPGAIPDEWRVTADATGAYELRLPDGFAPAPEASTRFIHGGQVWRRGEATIAIQFGHWGDRSFAGEAGQRCRVAIGGASVFVLVTPRRILAWYDRGSRLHEPVVAVSSNSESELATLAPVVLSLRRRAWWNTR